ncbi:MAG TPA: metallophosphoesterase family protein [Streptosporangiaceae bacterium]|nr:metallophosphoesterase family protein [Streptosporangiaceae bacterium]
MTQSMERAGVSRRSFMGGVGITAGGLLVASSPVLWQQAAKADTVTAEQVHLTFGQDPAREVAVSWVTPTSVSNPTVMVGTAAGGFGRKIPAETSTYTDSNNGIQTIAQHARIEGLQPDTVYVYRIVSDSETQLSGAFRTAPEGRVPFRFTSVGDIACGDTAFSKASLNAVATAAAVEQFDPVVHLVNGDLSYANSNQLSQPQVWAEYFDNTQLSAANRPWMPTLGNHENEPGNGPQGYLSYQTRFTLPKNHSSDFEGNWYKFQIGSVLFVMLDNNDVCYQVDTGTYLSTGDNQILTGYSGGAQEQWLERTLREASTDTSVDWIVVVMHQPAMSTSDAEGSDLGIRQNWMPLFYQYGVDFVLAGHDHDYERSYVVKGTDPGTILRPHVVSTELNTVNSDLGLVHLVIGTGGTKGHDDVYLTDTADDEPQEGINVSGTEIETEDAPWSAVTDPNTTYPWGIGVFDVDPGGFPGDKTTMTFTYYHTSAWSGSGPYPTPTEFDTFTATRTRSDGFGFRRRSAK